MDDVEHIVFDLSEVLMNGVMDFPYFVKAKIKKEFPGLQFPNDPSLYSNFFNSLEALFVGNISEDGFFDSFAGKYSVSVEKLKKLTRENFWQFEHTQSTLETLKSEEYPLFLFSDHAKEWIDYIESSFSFLGLFDKRIYSFDSHHTKIEPEAFQYLIEKTGINPSKTLFIDDMPQNLRVAIEAGIEYVHSYRDIQRLIKHFNLLEVRGFT